jgi:hypothetical protein
MLSEKELIEEIATLQRWIDDLHSGMYLNCLYCGFRHSVGATRQEMQEHIFYCEKHPLSKLKARCEELTAMNVRLSKQLVIMEEKARIATMLLERKNNSLERSLPRDT